MTTKQGDGDQGKVKWGHTLHVVDAPADSEAHLLPWDRTHPSWQKGDRKNKKESDSNGVTFRLPLALQRKIANIVQHRKIPEIENASDAYRWGVEMVIAWYAKITDDKALQEELELTAFESAQISRKNYRDRVTAVLDNLEADLDAAERMNRPNERKMLLDELAKYGPRISYDDLQARAHELYDRFSA